MIKNYFLTAWRNIVKNKLFFIINLIGLTTAYFSLLAILSYCSYELSFDNFHKNRKNIYRITTKVYKEGKLIADRATTPPPLTKILNELPEIKSKTCFTIPFDETKYIYNDNLIKASNIWSDSSFFNIFTFPIIAGDRKNPINPNAFLISERFAKKYFGKQNPIDQQIIVWQPNGKISKTVTGVFKLPENSHLDFDIIFSVDNSDVKFMKDAFNYEWEFDLAYVFVNVDDKTNIKSLEDKLLNLFYKYRLEDVKKANEKYEFRLQRVDDIYLHSNLFREARVNGNAKNIYTLLLVIFLLLIISWLNYNNLVTAQSLERAKEITMRKVIGANKLSIGFLSITETFIYNLISICIALVILVLLTSTLSQIVGNQIHVIYNNYFWTLILSTITFGSLFSGIYPAYRLASFKTKEVMHGKYSHSSKGIYIRKIFIIFQLIISLGLLIFTTLVSKQMSYMKNYDKSFNTNDIFVISPPESTKEIPRSSIVAFKNELLKYQQQITDISGSTDCPGKPIKFRTSVFASVDSTVAIDLDAIFTDENYLNLFNVGILYGRKFSKDFTSDIDQVIVNESAANSIGYSDCKEAIGKKIKLRGKWREIIGVVKNYNHLSLNSKIGPIIFVNQGNCYHNFIVKLQKENTLEGLKTIRRVGSELFPGANLEIKTLDEIYNNQYRDEDAFSNLLKIFSLILICITCFGLWGLILYDSTLKRKEISIRKVLGSNILNVILLQLKGYLFIFLISFIITIYPVYIICSNWLNNFPYQTTVGIGICIFPSLILFLIIVITVLYQTIKIALTNPATTLKNE